MVQQTQDPSARDRGASGPSSGDAAGSAEDAGGTVKQQVERGREKAAEGIGRAASRMRLRAEEKGGPGRIAGKSLAQGMDSAADYLHSHTAEDMWQRLMRFGRNHPAAAMAIALFLGYRIGRMLP